MAPAVRPVPPDAEVALGLATYLTPTAGMGGRLRAEPEDFQVIEVGSGPPRAGEGGGRFVAARVRLRNWETNRFVGFAAKALQIKRGQVSFAGMKDKRAVTEQWFSFQCPLERLPALEGLQDVAVLDSYVARDRWFPGAHDGNRFVLRVRDHHADKSIVQETVAGIASEGGVPNFFGPQRFGSFRPVTHRVGEAIVRGDLEEAVRLYVGNPMAGEHEATFEARKVYEETRDSEAALAVFPERLDPERSILKRLVRRPGEWRYALMALPHNLLQLFIHAWQSYLFNHVVTARIDAGLGLGRVHVGDLVMGVDEDGTKTHEVTARNLQKVQAEVDRGRATPTAPLLGLDTQMASGEPGEVEARTLESLGVDVRDFRCRELPQVASKGRRRGVLQPVRDLGVSWVDDDPVFRFQLGRGGYATVVLREFMKAELEGY